jgi:hypothetical protein
MKTVFLQDSVLLRALYPNYPNFEAALFKSPKYTAFADKIQGIRQELNNDFGRVEQGQEHSFRAVARHLTSIRGMLRGTIIQMPSYTALINFSLSAYGSYLQLSHISVLFTGDTPITLSLFFRIFSFFSHTSPPFN